MTSSPMDKIERLTALAAQHPKLQAAADPANRHAKLYRMLASHPDPMWREIGSQLRDGKMTLREMYANAEYRKHVHKGMKANREKLGSAIDAALKRLEETSGDDTTDRKPPKPRTGP